MSSIDKRIVEMVFDNKQFEQGVQTSINSLDRLNKSLKLDDSAKAANKSISSLNGINLDIISNGIAALEKRFSTFGIVGMEIIQRITNSVLNMGAQLKSITFGKIFQGGKNRAMNIEQARFMLQGMIDDQSEIAAIEKNARESVNDTAYTFDAAAKAAAQFAATGMRGGEQMQHALNGITGAAAMTNSQYEDMSRIFTTIAGNGKLMGDQLMQFSSRGMNVAANMKDYFNDVNTGAKEASDSVKETIKTLTNGKQITEGEFREMVSKGKISFEVFAESMYQLYGEHAKKANDTLTGVIANTGSALSKMGEKFYAPLVKQKGPLVMFFQTVKANIVEMRKFLDPIMVGLSDNIATALNRITKALKGMKFPDVSKAYAVTRNLTRVFEALWYSLQGVGNLFKTLGQTFRDFGVFNFLPDTDAIDAFFTKIKDGAKAFKEFTESSEGVALLKRIFSGLAAAFSIVLNILKAIKIALKPIIGSFNGLGSTILNVLASIGDALAGVNDWLEYDFKIFDKAEKVASVLENFKGVIKDIANVVEQYISKAFTKFKDKVTEITDSIREWFSMHTDIKHFFENMKLGADDVGEKLSPLAKVFGVIKAAAKGLWESIKTLSPLFESVVQLLKNVFGDVLSAISDIFTGKGFESTIALINGGVLTGVFTKLYQFIDLLTSEKSGDVKQKTLAEKLGIAGPLNNLTGVLKQMQAELKAEMLKQIAVSIAVIAGSVILLSQIEPKKLYTAVAAIGLLATELAAAMNALNATINDGFLGNKGILGSIDRVSDAFSTSLLGTALIKFAGAIAILAIAVAVLGRMDTKSITKGLIAITVLISEMVIVMHALPKDMEIKGATLIGFAMSMLILAGVLKIFAAMSLEEISKSLVMLGGSLFIIQVYLMTLGEAEGKITKGAAALMMIAPALVVLSAALKILSTMNLEQMCIALVSLGASMYILTVALSEMSNSRVIKGAAAMMMVAPAIVVLSAALKILATMNLEQMCIALVSLGASMYVLMSALDTMGDNRTLKGAGAMMMVAPAIVVLALALKVLSTMNVEHMCIALVSLGASMYILMSALDTMGDNRTLKGAAAMLIVAPAILTLSIALKTLGTMNIGEVIIALVALGGALAIFVGAAAIASKIPGLSVALLGLAGALAVLGLAITLFGAGALMFATAMALMASTGIAGAAAIAGMVGLILVELGNAAASILKFAATVIKAVCEALIESIPAICAALKAIIIALCDLLIECVPVIANTALEVIVAILGELATHIDDIVYQLGMIVLGIIQGLADFIEDHGDELKTAIGNLIVNLLYFAAECLSGLIDWVWGLIKDFFKGLWEKIKGFFGVHSPSTLFAELGKNLMLGLIEGIKAFGGLVLDVISGLIGEIASLFEGLIEKSGQVGESIYDALHPDEAGKDIDTARNAVLQKAFNQHNAGVKSSEVSGQEALFLRQIEDAEAAAKSGAEFNTAGMDAEIAKYYNQCKKEASGFYDSTTKAAAEAGKESGSQYNASHYAEIEKAKNQNAQQAEQYYEPNKTAAKEAGTVSGNNYDANHYAAIEQSKAKNKGRAESYYSPYTDIAKEYGLDSGMFYDTNTASGMDKYSNIVESSGEKVGSAGADGAKSQKREFYNAGAQYNLGLAKGISDPGAQGAVVKSVHNLGNRMVKELRRTLDERSPSRVAEDIGEFFVLGLKDGITDTENVATKAVTNLGENIITKMSDSLSSTDVEEKFSNIQDAMYKVAAFRDTDLNVHPTITPVLSLDNVNSGLAAIDQMFSTERSLQLSANAYSQFDDANNINNMLESMNSNNTKVVQAISDIRGDITKLETSMARMRIFLDSGALVGGIVTDVDNALGNIAFLKKRTGGM